MKPSTTKGWVDNIALSMTPDEALVLGCALINAARCVLSGRGCPDMRFEMTSPIIPGVSAEFRPYVEEKKT